VRIVADFCPVGVQMDPLDRCSCIWRFHQPIPFRLSGAVWSAERSHANLVKGTAPGQIRSALVISAENASALEWSVSKRTSVSEVTVMPSGDTGNRVSDVEAREPVREPQALGVPRMVVTVFLEA
jgi:hypothetical protein